MKYISICSGIEAATVAFHPLGWEPLAFSEIEPFPCKVLEHHYPLVPNLGDMTKYRDWSVELLSECDLIVGGCPCQAFSVAGLRNSLDDERGNLTIVYTHMINYIDMIRSLYGKPPVIIIYENVPGILSTHDGAFGCFLAGLAGEDEQLVPAGKRWTDAGVVYGPQRSIAWRIADAQHFGLAQRRRRVFVVASAGEVCPSSILFESEGVRRDTPPSRETGQGIALPVTGGPPFSRTGNERVECEAIVVQSIGIDEECNASIEHFGPLLRGGQGGTRQAVAFDCSSLGGGWAPQNVNPSVDVCTTMNCTNQEAVAFAQNTRDEVREMQVVGALAAQPGMKQTSYIRQQMQVRRLTPVECERLQGFPDDYTNIRENCPDGPRYKALGNSMAVPVMRWIGGRIDEAIRG